MDLGRQRVVARLAAVAEDREHDHRLDDHEDDDRRSRTRCRTGRRVASTLVRDGRRAADREEAVQHRCGVIPAAASTPTIDHDDHHDDQAGDEGSGPGPRPGRHRHRVPRLWLAGTGARPVRQLRVKPSGDTRRPSGGAGRAHHSGRSARWGPNGPCRADPCRVSHWATPRALAAESGDNARVIHRAVRRHPGVLPRRLAPGCGRPSPRRVYAHGGTSFRPSRPRCRCCSAGRSTRWSGCRRSSALRPVAGRRAAGRIAPTRGTRCRAPPDRRLGRGRRRRRVRARLGDRALRHDAVLRPHGPAHAADAGGAAAAAVRGTDHAAAAGLVGRRRGGAGSCRSCTRASSGSCRSRSWRGCCSRP